MYRKQHPLSSSSSSPSVFHIQKSHQSMTMMAVAAEDLRLDDNGTFCILRNVNVDATRLRFHAYCRKDSSYSPAQVWVAFHLRYKRQWLDDEELALVRDWEYLYIHLCQKHYYFPITSEFRKPHIVKEKLLEMKVPDVEMVAFWARVIAEFAFVAAMVEEENKTGLMTMVVELGCEKPFRFDPYIDRDMYDDCEVEEEEDGHDCVVCLEELEVSSGEVVTLPCSHSFHCGCLGRWFEEKIQCPLCRSEIH